MTTVTATKAPDRTQFTDLLVRVFLVVVIALQLLFLARWEFFRIDLTADHDFTLTRSTRNLLAELDRRVLVKAFFTRETPPAVGPIHERIKDLLREYRAFGGGRLVVEYVDPDEDQSLRDEADRLGIAAMPVQSAGEGQLSLKRVYQGLRLRAGDRQKVLDLAKLVMEGAQTGIKPSQFEYQLTNALAELVVDKKPKVVLSAKAETAPSMNPFQPQQGGTSYRTLKSAIEGRFVVEELDFGPKDKLPEETALLVLVKPKGFDDMQRFMLDQYLVKGGRAILFLDQNDFALGQHWKRGDVDSGLEELLAHHGVQVKRELVGDIASSFPQRVPQRMRLGGQMVQVGYLQVPYPYWIIAANRNWAEQFPEVTGVQPGMNRAEAAVSQLESAFFFWPTPVPLKEELPEGLSGVELVRTSPMSYAEAIPQSVDPGMDEAGIRSFLAGWTRKRTEKPGRQYPLAVKVSGRFTSFFKGKPLPQPPAEAPAASPAPGDDDRDHDGLPQEAPQAPASQPAAGTAAQVAPASQPAETPASQPAAPAAPKQPPLELVERTDREGTLVVVGDASLVEDTFFNEQNGALYQANSALVLNLVDDLALAADLVELRGRNTKVRLLKIVEPEEDESPDRLDARRRQKIQLIQWGHRLAVPCLLLLFGLGVYLVRRARKRSFVQSLG